MSNAVIPVATVVIAVSRSLSLPACRRCSWPVRSPALCHPLLSGAVGCFEARSVESSFRSGERPFLRSGFPAPCYRTVAIRASVWLCAGCAGPGTELTQATSLSALSQSLTWLSLSVSLSLSRSLSSLNLFSLPFVFFLALALFSSGFLR